MIGVLQVLNRRSGGAFTPDDVDRFQHLLSQCSRALENALTYEHLRHAESHGAEPQSRSPRVLLAEHDAAVADQVRELLSIDLVVLEARNIRDIVWTAQAERPDLVLLGVADDGSEGVATCRALRACPLVRETPIIMLAMAGRPDYVVAAFEAGADDYIARPFSPAQLRAKTHTWLLRAGSTGRGSAREPAPAERERPRGRGPGGSDSANRWPDRPAAGAPGRSASD